MRRREFMAVAGLGALALGTGAAPGAARGAEAHRGGGTVGPPLGPEEERILSLASLAPNGHNAQPWSVKAEAKDRWIVGVDPARRLPAVDPTDRETVISLGTFLENLVQGARALGREVSVGVLSDRRDAPALYQVRLAPRPAGDAGAVLRIEARRTQRKGFRSDPLAAADRDALLAAAGAGAWFPAGSKEAGWLRQAAVESFTFQSGRDDAQAELQRWMRFTPEEVRERRDGMNPRTMEMGFVARFYMEHFVDASTVMTKGFRQRGIDMLAEQARQGAGFLVLWSRDESVPSLLDTGRRWERVALGLRERKLAAHPMSQMLEEERWRTQVAREVGAGGPPQAVLRVGYVDETPPPVSPRRPLSSFVRIG